jgi:beta-lactamase class A
VRTVSDHTVVSTWRRAATEFVGGDAGRSVTITGGTTRVSVAGDVQRPGASVLKLALALAVCEHHPEALSMPVAVADLPTSRWPSIMDALAPSHRLTLRELAGIMLVTSDNRSAEYLTRLLGPGLVNETLRAHGCTSTRLDAGFGDEALGDEGRVNVATTDECADLLGAIHREEHLRPVLTALRANLNHTRIQLRLPDEVVVAHKTGSLRGVVNDVGVIHAEAGPLTVCFLTDAQPDPAATAADIGRCALRAYTTWMAAAC